MYDEAILNLFGSSKPQLGAYDEGKLHTDELVRY